mmetsp:Transcript_8648/g.25990  ORF Transcript_8648/g.25990 Transcript_8648/m.25990 type:complete len:89 (+) Transcript_8648:1104-1370(+)
MREWSVPWLWNSCCSQLPFYFDAELAQLVQGAMAVPVPVCRAKSLFLEIGMMSGVRSCRPIMYSEVHTNVSKGVKSSFEICRGWTMSV